MDWARSTGAPSLSTANIFQKFFAVAAGAHSDNCRYADDDVALRLHGNPPNQQSDDDRPGGSHRFIANSGQHRNSNDHFLRHRDHRHSTAAGAAQTGGTASSLAPFYDAGGDRFVNTGIRFMLRIFPSASYCFCDSGTRNDCALFALCGGQCGADGGDWRKKAAQSGSARWPRVHWRTIILALLFQFLVPAIVGAIVRTP